MRALIVALVLAGTLPVLGHNAPMGWAYDSECCSDRDCQMYQAKNVKQVPGGYELITGEFVAQSKVKQSKDEEYHLCRSPTTQTIFCLYVPPQGS